MHRVKFFDYICLYMQFNTCKKLCKTRQNSLSSFVRCRVLVIYLYNNQLHIIDWLLTASAV